MLETQCRWTALVPPIGKPLPRDVDADVDVAMDELNISMAVHIVYQSQMLPFRFALYVLR